MSTVAIIGAGLIDSSWAIVFVRAGWTAVLWDPAEGRGARCTPARSWGVRRS